MVRFLFSAVAMFGMTGIVSADWQKSGDGSIVWSNSQPIQFVSAQPSVTVTGPTVTVNQPATQSWSVAAPVAACATTATCASSASTRTVVRSTMTVSTRAGVFQNRPRLFGHVFSRRGGC